MGTLRNQPVGMARTDFAVPTAHPSHSTGDEDRTVHGRIRAVARTAPGQSESVREAVPGAAL